MWVEVIGSGSFRFRCEEWESAWECEDGVLGLRWRVRGEEELVENDIE